MDTEIFFVALGLEFRAYSLSHSTSLSPPPPLFCEGFFEIGSCELFAQHDFKPQASWVTRIIGVSHQQLANTEILNQLKPP
jgi:hypothetical protein